jgi:hypothetical protein
MRQPLEGGSGQDLVVTVELALTRVDDIIGIHNVHRRATSSRCHRNRVVGVTKNIDQRGRGSSRDNTARIIRSAGWRSGRCTWRRSTATWWRSTRISTSLAPPSRASWVNICPTWRTSRYIIDAVMASIVWATPALRQLGAAGEIEHVLVRTADAALVFDALGDVVAEAAHLR